MNSVAADITMITVFLSVFTVFHGNDFHSSLIGGENPPVVIIPGMQMPNMDIRVKEEYLDKPEIKSCPGIRHSEWKSFWMDLGLEFWLTSDHLTCLEEALSLHYNVTDHKTYNSPGIELRTSGNWFGDTSSVEHMIPSPIKVVPYMMPLIDYMILMGGYQKEHSLVAAPYDWRKAPNELDKYFNKLRRLIEKTFFKNGRKKVVIFGQSLGGLYAVNFLHRQNQRWKDKYVRKLIIMSTPLGGTVAALETYTKGLVTEFVVEGKEKLRRTMTSFPSLTFLLPNRYGFGLEDILVKQYLGPDITLRNMIDFVAAVDKPTIRNIHQDQVAAANLTHPGVPISCLYSYGWPTTEQLVYQQPEDFPRNPTIIFGDGDGMVNRKSLEACTIWASQADVYNFEVVAMKGHYQHTALLGSYEAIAVIFNMITK